MTNEEALPPDDADMRTDGPDRRSRRLLWIGLAVIAMLIAIGLWLASRPPAQQLQGEVDADEVNVATKALARVEAMHVNEGDTVKKGQLLATLSAPEIANGEQQAQAALDSARALQSIAAEGLRGEDVASLRATWQATQANADLAAVTAHRADRLFAQGVIAAQRRDEAHAARDATARAAEAAKAQYDKALAGTRPQNRAVADAQVRAAAAGVSTAESLHGETRLVAPIDGEIARKLLQPGEIVTPLLPAFQIIDVRHPWVRLNVREDAFHGLAIGKQIAGHVPALDRTIRFRIVHISPQGAFATARATRQSTGYDVRAFAVKLEPAGPADGLRPGMSVLVDWPQ